MQIVKESKFYGFRGEDADRNIALVFLEDGTWLLVHDDGTATGANGLRYFHVAREIEETPLSPDPFFGPMGNPNPQPIHDTVLEDLGWTTDGRAPMYYPLNSDDPVESTIPQTSLAAQNIDPV